MSSLEPDIGRLLDQLVDWGFQNIPHSGASLLQHLVGVFNELRRCEFPADICVAGLFHSAESFLSQAGQETGPLTDIVGPGPAQIIERYSQSRLQAGAPEGARCCDAEDVVAITLANAVEQLPRLSRAGSRPLVDRVNTLVGAWSSRTNNSSLCRLIQIAQEKVRALEKMAPVQFVKVHPDVPAIERLDGTLKGAAPQRAALFCHPFTTANGFGWAISPPVDLDLRWDGSNIFYRRPLKSDWAELGNYIELEFAQSFKDVAPSEVGACAGVPLIASAPERGLVQMWTGLFASTAPGWSLLLRPLANRPRDPRYDVLEGLIETDWWFGPLVFPILFRRETTIQFRRRRPIIQIQPILRACYDDDMLGDAPPTIEISQLSTSDWEQIHQSLALPSSSRKPGAYRAEARRQQRHWKSGTGG